MASIHPYYPLQSGESNKDRDGRKDRIRKSNKISSITVEDKAQHVALDRIFIQRFSIRAEELSRAYNAALERVCIQH